LANKNPELASLIGDHLKQLRVQSGMSQEALAEKSGLHRTYIGACERGERNITIINLNRLCQALNTNLATFFLNNLK
jgi:transcriptional regulator with XRE-family HTH domain